MIRIASILLLTIFCFQLNAQKKAKKIDDAEFPLQMKTIMGSPLDSLLAHPNMSPVAIKIVKGKKALGTDAEFMGILDSVTKAMPETRPMYIHILVYANKMAEGTLADSLGKYNINLLKMYPKEVLRYFKKGETDERIADAQKSFEDNIAFEMNGSGDPKEAFDELVDKVFEKYKSKDTSAMDKMFKGIKKAMKL